MHLISSLFRQYMYFEILYSQLDRLGVTYSTVLSFLSELKIFLLNFEAENIFKDLIFFHFEIFQNIYALNCVVLG